MPRCQACFGAQVQSTGCDMVLCWTESADDTTTDQLSTIVLPSSMHASSALGDARHAPPHDCTTRNFMPGTCEFLSRARQYTGSEYAQPLPPACTNSGSTAGTQAKSKGACDLLSCNSREFAPTGCPQARGAGFDLQASAWLQLIAGRRMTWLLSEPLLCTSRCWCLTTFHEHTLAPAPCTALDDALPCRVSQSLTEASQLGQSPRGSAHAASHPLTPLAADSTSQDGSAYPASSSATADGAPYPPPGRTLGAPPGLSHADQAQPSLPNGLHHTDPARGLGSGPGSLDLADSAALPQAHQHSRQEAAAEAALNPKPDRGHQGPSQASSVSSKSEPHAQAGLPLALAAAQLLSPIAWTGLMLDSSAAVAGGDWACAHHERCLLQPCAVQDLQLSCAFAFASKAHGIEAAS